MACQVIDGVAISEAKLIKISDIANLSRYLPPFDSYLIIISP